MLRLQMHSSQLETQIRTMHADREELKYTPVRFTGSSSLISPKDDLDNQWKLRAQNAEEQLRSRLEDTEVNRHCARADRAEQQSKMLQEAYTTLLMQWHQFREAHGASRHIHFPTTASTTGAAVAFTTTSPITPSTYPLLSDPRGVSSFCNAVTTRSNPFSSYQ
jgi:hypothetical protein